MAPILNGLLGIGVLATLVVMGRDLMWNAAQPIDALTYLLHRTAMVLAGWVTLSGLIVAWATTAWIGSTIARSLARFAVPWLRRLAVSGVAGAIVVTGTLASSLPSLASEVEPMSPSLELPEPLRDILHRDQSQETDVVDSPKRVRRDARSQKEQDRDSTPATLRAVQATEVEVRAGDNLWDISARHVAAVGDSTPSQLEIADYWQKLIEANRASLVSGDPDLIYPGETIRLPPTKPTSSQG